MRRFLVALALVAAAVFSPAYGAPTWPTSPANGDTYEYLGRTYSYDSASGIWKIAGALGPGIKVEFITADDASWDPAPGMRYMEVWATGEGGGGGGAQATDSDSAAVASAGGPGETRYALYTAEEIGASVNISIGTSGGAGGSTSGGDGTAGENTVFDPAGSGATLTAGGGGGGTGQSAAGYGVATSGGASSTGSGGTPVHNGRGGVGSYSQIVSGANTRTFGGHGADSFYGGGGTPGVTVTGSTAGGAATNYGGGGGGAVNVNDSTDVAGGDGYQGVVKVVQYLGESYGTDGKQGFVGELIWYTGSTCPSGTLTANGAEVSRATYNDLWAAISDDAVVEASQSAADYGTGNTTTTFSLMDMTSTYGWIVSALSTPATYGSVLESQAPDIDGTLTNPSTQGSFNAGTGAISVDQSSQRLNAGSVASSNNYRATFAASADDATYSDSVDEISVPSIPMTPCIVY